MGGAERRDSFDGIAIFVRVAPNASFTEVARHLGLSASGVSRAIARRAPKPADTG
ncbi:MAG: LysR family transcriptional regulator [Defluviicoccus sp.]|nr:LysR family transcriptional regulator [Defluviicoccus sp.]